MIKGHDGTWYLAIRTRKLARAEDFIVSLGGEKGGEIAAEVTEKDLYDTTGKGRLLYEKIIFGCVGGVFHAADGVRSARVKACIASENGDSVARLRFVHWRTAADNEKDAGVQSSGTADQFFERFPPASLGAAAAGGVSDGGGGGGGGKAARELRTIRPAGMSALQAAAVFFRGRALLDAAGVNADDISELREELEAAAAADMTRLELRFGAALGRLAKRIGEFRGPGPPEDEAALVELAEAALDQAIRVARDVAKPAGAAVSGEIGSSGQFGGQHQPRLGGGLSLAQQRSSVSAEVAASLRPHAVLLQQQWAGDVGGGISMAPRDIRDDLRRATLSSGRVHAPGAAKHMAHLPPAVSAMRERLVALVTAALESTAKVDATGRWRLPNAVAYRLAQSLVEGSPQLADFAAAVAASRGSMAPGARSLDEIGAAWDMAKVGFETIIAAVFGVSADLGVRAISNHVGDAARAQELDPERLRTWLERVMDDWGAELRDFRVGGATPSLQRCVDMNQSYIAFTVMTAAVASDVLRASRKRQRGRRGRKRAAEAGGAAPESTSEAEDDSEDAEDGSERGEGSEQEEEGSDRGESSEQEEEGSERGEGSEQEEGSEQDSESGESSGDDSD